MAGISNFARISLGKENPKGTPVATTRRFYGEVAGNFDIGDSWATHMEENRGLRTRPSRTPTLLKEFPHFTLADTDGIGYDDLVQPWAMGLQGGLTGVGAGADKTWTYAPKNTSAAGSNANESFSADIGDDVQSWRLQYLQPSAWTLSTELGGQTHLSMDCFAQRAIKTAASTPAEISPVKMPADLWTVKFAATLAGLPGASISTNFLRTFSLAYNTGLKPRFYADGNTYFGQTVETDLTALLTLEVESTSLAVSEFVDKYRGGTLDFVRLKHTGPVIPTTAVPYSCQIDLPVFWNEPKVIASTDDGVNLYTVTANLAYDTSASIGAVLVGTLATIP